MASILTDIFDSWRDDFAAQTSHKNYNKPVEVIEVPCCHKDDQEPVSIIWPDAKHGPWIAGGAALRWYQGLPVGDNDIDIFCSSAEQVQEVIDKIKSYGRFSTKYESDNAITLSYHNNDSKYWTLQVIKRRYFKDMQEVIDTFDISACQVGTDGMSWAMGKDTARDIREMNLRMRMPLQPDAAKRLAKYWTYGYRPVPGLLEAIQTNPVGKKEFAIDGDYENAF